MKRTLRATLVLPTLLLNRRDLDSGDWERRDEKMLALDSYDAGCRLVVASIGSKM